MATITEDYVSFKIAKLLKEKGFDQNCATYYLDGQVWRHYHGEVTPKGKQIYAAPTQAMAMKWLRIEHNIFIEPIVGENDGRDWYDFDIIPVNGRVIHSLPQVPVIECDSPEEAIEEALKYCLEKLI